MEAAATPLGFGPGTAAGAYWLTRCVGFRVLGANGRLIGTVLEIEADDGEVVLVCRCGSGRLAVDASSVETVWPGHFLLVLREQAEDAPSMRVVPPPTLPEEVLPATRTQVSSPYAESVRPRAADAGRFKTPAGRPPGSVFADWAVSARTLAREAGRRIAALLRELRRRSRTGFHSLRWRMTAFFVRARRAVARRLAGLARAVDPIGDSGAQTDQSDLDLSKR